MVQEEAVADHVMMNHDHYSKQKSRLNVGVKSLDYGKKVGKGAFRVVPCGATVKGQRKFVRGIYYVLHYCGLL